MPTVPRGMQGPSDDRELMSSVIAFRGGNHGYLNSRPYKYWVLCYDDDRLHFRRPQRCESMNEP